MKRIFVSIKSAIENKLYKFPKRLEISKNSSVDAACFFIDMEKIFGSESIINELEEDDTETDEENYNNQFMSDLNHKEKKYANKKVYSNSISPEGTIDKYRISSTNSKGKQKVVTTSQYQKKLKESRSNNIDRPKYSPYTDSGKYIGQYYANKNAAPSKHKASGHVKTIKRKKGSSSKVAASRSSKIPSSATTHTSSIPSLPPVVRDSMLKDKYGRNNLEDIKKRLQHNPNDFLETYQDTDNIENRVSIEPSQFERVGSGKQLEYNQRDKLFRVRKSYENQPKSKLVFLIISCSEKSAKEEAAECTYQQS